MFIKKDKFLAIIDATPLVSIDLIIENSSHNILLGKRVNRPAQGSWFVPGGRINKNEKIAEAIERISVRELGVCITLSDANLVGVYDHIYDDNFHQEEGINTHYVVLAYRVVMADDCQFTLDEQHSALLWWEQDLLLADDGVHQNTKAYFR